MISLWNEYMETPPTIGIDMSFNTNYKQKCSSGHMYDSKYATWVASTQDFLSGEQISI